MVGNRSCSCSICSSIKAASLNNTKINHYSCLHTWRMRITDSVLIAIFNLDQLTNHNYIFVFRTTCPLQLKQHRYITQSLGVFTCIEHEGDWFSINDNFGSLGLAYLQFMLVKPTVTPVDDILRAQGQL